MTKTTSPWRSMGTAPMDGTIILVTETPNGEHFNVLPAAFMNSGGGQVQFHESPVGMIGWWAVTTSRYTGQGRKCPLPVTWKPLKSTPVCWMPMPDIEPFQKLQRRLAQVMSPKGKTREKELVVRLTALA